MDFLRAGIGIVVVIALALLLGRVEHCKHPAEYTYAVIGSIAVLLILRFFL